jgi:hypothetical protein
MNQHQKSRRRKFAALMDTDMPPVPRRRYYMERLPVAHLDPAETRRWFVPRCEMKR